MVLGFRKCLICLALIGALAVGGSALAEVDSLALKDQFGSAGGLKDDADSLQIAIVVSAKRLRRLKPWEQAIRDYDESLAFIRVADVPRTAPTEYSDVAEKLRKRLPEDVNVLIDLDGIWATQFELDPSVPNVLLFDGSGQFLVGHAGMFKKARFLELKADLDRILAEEPDQSP